MDRRFLGASAVLLWLTGLVKFVSAFGHAQILSIPDPVTHISTKHLLLFAGLVEMIAAVFMFLGRRTEIKFLVLAWLTLCFVSYKLVAFVTDVAPACPCLGTITEILAIDPAILAGMSNVALGFFVLGCGIYWSAEIKRFFEIRTK